MSRASSTTIALALLGACSAVPDPPRAIPAAVERVRAALGAPAAGGPVVVLSGTIRGPGGEGAFEHTLRPDGAFARTTRAELVTTAGYDGETTWKVGPGGAARPLGLGAAVEARWDAWLESCAWAHAALAESVRPSTEDGRIVLADGSGRTVARVRLDGASGLPVRVERETAAGVERTDVLAWGEVGGWRLPFRWTRVAARAEAGEEPLEFLVEEAHVVEAPGAVFQPLLVPPTDTSFEPARPSGVAARRLASGHVLVRGHLDGTEPVWFLLDTGAGLNVVDTRLADRLGWEPFGSVAVAGAGGRLQARFRRGGLLDVGRASIAGLPWLELDLDALSERLGAPLGGVLGFDLFARCVVAIDWTNSSVELFDPARHPGPDDDWEELRFDDTAPCVFARYSPGKDGWFRVDTGSDDTVAFHPTTVRRLGLGASIEDVQSVIVEGVGGTAHGKRGRIDWFQLGGRRILGPRVTLIEAGWGALDDPWLAGNLGIGFFANARVVFHYPAGRMLVRQVPRDGRSTP